VQLQNILMSKYVEFFSLEVSTWQKKLMVSDMVISVWLDVQQTWAHLQSIFANSEDIRNQLPEDARRFDGIDLDFKDLMENIIKTNIVIKVTNEPGLLAKLETLLQRLKVCEKSLADYLESKRLRFPRFYFVSSNDLLEIISKGTQPKQVIRHFLKLFDNIADLRFDDEDGECKIAIGMYSKEKEFVYFTKPCVCEGQAESWLRLLEEAMKSTVRQEIMDAVAGYEDKLRDQWLFDYSAQVALTASQIWWATDVEIAFKRFEEGFENALKDYNRKQIAQLNALINMLLGELTPGVRQKIMTICTIDVHARDVVAKLIAQKVSNGQAFTWLSQLRHHWDEVTKDCFVNICDAQFQYSYEYLGNTPRLVITPLTDRCYITLTQSLHLSMSGALSGPAGTGKTETTKDLGRALGIMVYVFNCSEQMDYKTHRNISRLEDEMRKLQETAELFEVSIPEYKQLRHCRSAIVLLKSVWDMVVFVRVLVEMNHTWSTMQFSYEKHSATGTPLLKSDEDLIETLEDNQVQLQNILMSKYVEFFSLEVSTWQKKLMVSDMVISVWLDVQQTWAHLQSIFANSEDIRNQLPEDARRFDGIDLDFKDLMENIIKTNIVIKVTNEPGLLAKLETLLQRLKVCEKSLADYLESKRLRFPRFYFVSSNDLLEIISKGTQPKQVIRHFLKLFDNIADLRFDDEDGECKIAIGMYSKEKEFVYFTKPCVCEGQAESWLRLLEEAMKSTVRQEIMDAVAGYEDKLRDQWLFDYSAQVALTASQIWWATDVEIAFKRFEEGFENALKDYNRKQIAQLNALINMLLGELTPGVRQKIMTICTIDVHARDVVAKLIAQKVSNGQAFTWLSQLRHHWDEVTKDCFVNICDAQFQYSYEYLGNTPRLVITPLTDRCYITLTQSLHLSMSGALSGPAGTGKTETTKDLGRALGIMVYVFNCSEQMDYKSLGNIYMGLCQTGVWGCFDEFNRISVEVLSVIAVQVKTIQDAIRHNKKRFHFIGETVELNSTVGIFITLNPGYAGRAELPENVKTLFR
ncbi:dynein axonemal heavy chain 11-like, partial [Pyxicephalus adspersus]|uniref:dynein axonemal heavy chain 11-like n=1 Tax=Pyxicephalus adspersus TaxID=30357 RepID=UPI003B591D08